MKARPHVRFRRKSPAAADYDLKFVPIHSRHYEGGGWYRELPGNELEVMSRGHIERVPLERHADPVRTAKAALRRILKRHS